MKKKIVKKKGEYEEPCPKKGEKWKKTKFSKREKQYDGTERKS